MAAKAFIVLCASAVLIEIISGQYINAGVIDINNVNGIGSVTNTLGSSYPGCGHCKEINAGSVSVTNVGVGSTIGGFGLSSGLGFGATNVGYAGVGAAGLGAVSLGNAYAAPCYGGAFPVTSYSVLAPTGLSVYSENTIEGPVVVSGALPFLSAVALEGQVPSGGATSVSYSCGDGNVGIVSEGLGGAAGGYGYGAGLAGGVAAGGYGCGAGLAGGVTTGVGLGAGVAGGLIAGGGCGCGCGGIYY